VSADQWRFIDIVRAQTDAGPSEAQDTVAIESPLQVLVNGVPFAVIMRTPGLDAELATGFLYSEGVIASAADVVRLHSGSMANGRAFVDAAIPGVDVSSGDAARRVTTTSSCGLCGRVSVESLDVTFPAIELNWSVAPAVIAKLPERLIQAQAAFAHTGGLHAAGLFTPRGELVLLAEDVGRHNAVDKVIGAALRGGTASLAGTVMLLSGRAGFELVQKAAIARVPVVCSVSAPSALAVDLAEEVGTTLVGFVRGGSANVYTHPYRII